MHLSMAIQVNDMKVKGSAAKDDDGTSVKTRAYREPVGRGKGTAGGPTSLSGRQGLWGSSGGVLGLDPGMLQGLFWCHPLIGVPLQAGLHAMTTND